MLLFNVLALTTCEKFPYMYVAAHVNILLVYSSNILYG